MTFEDQLAELTRQGRYEAAAELCQACDQPLEAARLWIRACKFERAAHEFLKAKRADEAVLSAALAGDAGLIEASLSALAAVAPLARANALRLEARGFHRIAAELNERLQELDEAARLYRRAHAFVDAARVLLRAEQFDAALRSLEEALEYSASDEVARLALATLLERRGRLREAARLLQQLDDRASLAGPMLRQLARVLTKLELPGAAREAVVRSTRLAAAPAKLPAVLREFEPHDAGGAPGSATGELLFGRYETLELVATTATARVYKARDRISDQTVAVKLFSPSLTSGTGRDAFFRFEREVRVLQELKHPFVVPLLAYHPEGPALILKWMSGGSLAQRLDAGSPSPEQGAFIVSRVLSALSEAHRRGILHRDIKPDNILFDEHGAPYLGDFGTAHVADHAQTVTQGVLGTLAYMAPPQRQGEPATIQSDLFSVGAVFWHVLTGGPPGLGQLFGDALTPSQRRLAERWLELTTLPDSAAEMLALLRSETWPATPRVAPARALTKDTPAPARKVRFELDGSDAFDHLLQRRVRLHPASAETLERARRFAAADHPGLATVLGYDPDTTQLCLESLERRAPGTLTPAHKSQLAEALRRLHAVGGSHGAIDQAHVGWRGSEPVLAFPGATKPVTLSEDLTRLGLVR